MIVCARSQQWLYFLTMLCKNDLAVKLPAASYRGLDRQLTGILCGTLALQLPSGALQGVIKTAREKKNHLATPFTPVTVCSTSCPPLWGTGVLNALQSQGQFLSFSNHIVGLGNVHLPQCNSISWTLDFLGAMVIFTLPKTEVCEPL